MNVFSILNGLLIKAIGVLLLVSVFFTMLSLFSYHPNDPSVLYSTNAQVQNWGGIIGSSVADLSMQSIGYAVFYPMLFFAILAFRLLKRQPVPYLMIRATILLTTLPIICATLSVMSKLYRVQSSFYGGFLGDFIATELSQYLSLKILALILIKSSIVGMIGSLGLNLKEWKKITLLFFKAFIYIPFKSLKYKIIPYIIRRNSIATDSAPQLSTASTRVQLSKTESKKKSTDQNTEIAADKDLEDFVPHTINIGSFTLPDTELLNILPSKVKAGIGKNILDASSAMLAKVLEDFGVSAILLGANPGPVVTLYEFEPAAGTKSSRVIGLADDIARSMRAVSARISVIPGKNAIGIELPNSKRETVYLREILESKEYRESAAALPLILGKNISGSPVIADLAKMPHLLVAGTTGSGKSVAINTMILSLLYKHSPETCKFVMIDPKMLELSVYDGIPHLLSPVVTDPKKAVIALKWVVKEMEERYKAMSTLGVRNINGYNAAIVESIKSGTNLTKTVQTGFDRSTGKPIFERIAIENKELPYIVVIVDEMADLMLVAGKDIEAYIQRLAQMARAAGIHIVMATQRPSVDVITGVIKANFPTRISFQVTSKIDSRTILGEQGAEQLLGMGDMLYMMPGGKIERVHGPFVDDKEVESVVQFCTAQGDPEYIEEITIDEDVQDNADVAGEDGDDLYNQALAIVLKDRKVSTSYIQRCLRIGYNRAAIIVEKMEKNGIISAPNHVGKREILDS